MSKAHIRHTAKSSNFVTRFCCSTKLPVCLTSELPQVEQLNCKNCKIETISIPRQFFGLLPSCDCSICVFVNFFYISNIHLMPVIERLNHLTKALLIIMLSSVSLEVMFVWRLFANRKLTVVQ